MRFEFKAKRRKKTCQEMVHTNDDVRYKQGGAEDVKRHRWFKNIDWDDVVGKKLRPPIVPNVGHEGDARNYDDYPETDWRKVPPVGEREVRHFDDF